MGRPSCWLTKAKSRTDDVDLIGERTGLLKRLSEEAGKGSELHRATDYYVDIVPPGLFPQDWGWRSRTTSLELPGLEHIELRILELHDLILSKLKRFAGKDREDIRGLCEREKFDIETLRSRYTQARLPYDYDEREKLEANFRFIESEFLALEPTDFD
ncbi:MAG: DUF6036 family nucleotidyltransferase [Vicinamibacteria bacterium]